MTRLPGYSTVPARNRRNWATLMNSGHIHCCRSTCGGTAWTLGTPAWLRLHRILTQGEIRPHKIRYYVERRDPEFEARMAVVLHVYKEVEIVNEELIKGTLKEPPVVTISYD